MGVGFDDLSLEAAADTGAALARGEGFSYVVTPNPEIVELARDNEDYRRVLNQAALVLPDGIGVIYASRLLGVPLGGRVPGIDFASALLERLAKSGEGVFLLGAKPGVAEEAAQRLGERYPGLNLCGTVIFRTAPLWWRPFGLPGRRWPLCAWGRPSRSSGWRNTVPPPGRS